MVSLFVCVSDLASFRHKSFIILRGISVDVSLGIFDYLMSILVKELDISLLIFDYFKSWLVEVLDFTILIGSYLVTSFVISFSLFAVKALGVFDIKLAIELLNLVTIWVVFSMNSIFTDNDLISIFVVSLLLAHLIFFYQIAMPIILFLDPFENFSFWFVFLLLIHQMLFWALVLTDINCVISILWNFVEV